MTKVKAMDPDDLFAYSTIKLVTIRDRRLGILHYLFMLAIFVYIIVYTIIIQQRYLKTEVPFGSIRATLREPAEFVDAATIPYCLQNQASYQGRENYDCAYMLGRDSPYPPAPIDNIFITTRIKDSIYQPPPNCTTPPSITGLPTDLNCAPSTTSSIDTRYWINDVEHYTVYIEHAIYGEVTDITATNSGLKGALQFPDGSTIEIANGGPYRSGTGDIFTVSDVLDAAGVGSLDGVSSVDPANSKRYDGVFIIVVIEYSNRVSDASEFKYKYYLRVLPGLDVIAQEPTTVVNGSTFGRSRYGVHLMFVVAGTIGVFDFPTLLTSIVNGMVLLKVATTIVDLLLLYAMPEKDIYKKSKYELTEDFSDLREMKKQNKQHLDTDQ